MVAYPSTITLLHRLKTAGVATALVTASRNSAAVLADAGVTELFLVIVDGDGAASLHQPRLHSRPSSACMGQRPRRQTPGLDLVYRSTTSRPGRHTRRHHQGRRPPWRHGGDSRSGPRCFSGLETRDDLLWLHPVLPPELSPAEFTIVYRGQQVKVELTPRLARLRLRMCDAAPIAVCVEGLRARLHPGEVFETPLRRHPVRADHPGSEQAVPNKPND